MKPGPRDFAEGWQSGFPPQKPQGEDGAEVSRNGNAVAERKFSLHLRKTWV
jgi:hypothetical protein